MLLAAILQKYKKINDNLEQLAKTLYDYWFVQFEFPDKNGKPYKSNGGKMVWNEKLKREIPEEWKVDNLSSIANTASGGTPLSTKIEYYENGDIPWINSGELNNPYIVGTPNFITQLGLINSSARLFKKKTLLMAMYGATAGKVSMLEIDACTNQAICAISPKNDFYLYYLRHSLIALSVYLINLSTGSARDNLSQDKIKALIIMLPPDSILSEFNLLVSEIVNKSINNLKQSIHLTTLRDWLVPMLMNGQVKVSD